MKPADALFKAERESSLFEGSWHSPGQLQVLVGSQRDLMIHRGKKLLRSTKIERNLLDLKFISHKLLEAGMVFGEVSNCISLVDLPIWYLVCFFLL